MAPSGKPTHQPSGPSGQPTQSSLSPSDFFPLPQLSYDYEDDDDDDVEAPNSNFPTAPSPPPTTNEQEEDAPATTTNEQMEDEDDDDKEEALPPLVATEEEEEEEEEEEAEVAVPLLAAAQEAGQNDETSYTTSSKIPEETLPLVAQRNVDEEEILAVLNEVSSSNAQSEQDDNLVIIEAPQARCQANSGTPAADSDSEDEDDNTTTPSSPRCKEESYSEQDTITVATSPDEEPDKSNALQPHRYKNKTKGEAERCRISSASTSRRHRQYTMAARHQFFEDSSDSTLKVNNKSIPDTSIPPEHMMVVSPMPDWSSNGSLHSLRSGGGERESFDNNSNIAPRPEEPEETKTITTTTTKKVKSLHSMYSASEIADVTYTLDVISKLRRDIYIVEEENSVIDIVDDSPPVSKKKQHQPQLPPRPPPINYIWTYLTEDILHTAISRFIMKLSKFASRNPYLTVGAVVFLSFALAGIGLCTNFTMIFDHEVIFTPMYSLPTKHGEWVYDKAGFEDGTELNMIIHSDGDNIMHMDAMRRTFEALDTLRNTEGYEELCATSTYLNLKGKPDCWVWSTTQFWKHDIEKFNEEITNDHDLIQIISQDTFPDGTPVHREASFGKHVSVPETRIDSKGQNVTFELLTYVPNFIVSVGLPDTTQGEYFQWVALERLKELKKRWELEDQQSNPKDVKLEFFTVYAYLLEYERALNKDMPLAPLTFYVMLLFTCIVFHRLGLSSGKSPTGVEPSRFSLGMLSTFTIGMSLMSGYGLMFCLGIPFTNLSQMVPFIILGVGLDDTFIITGAYFRKLSEEHRIENQIGNEQGKDQNAIITERIVEVMEEVGLSIALTTTTTTFAFFLGCLSTIPGIRWVCLYAGVTIFIDFIYQITLFVAFLTLDERRMITARETAKKQGDVLYIANIYARMRSTLPKNQRGDRKDGGDDEVIFTQRIMRWYANQLLRPTMKILVLVVFSVLFVWCVWRTMQLRQAFNVEDYVPDDSYIKPFFTSLEHYASIKLGLTLYFRNVNQSDPVIQDQMREYVTALSDLPQVRQPPDFCWVRDLHAYMSGEAAEDMDADQARQAATIAAAIQGKNRTFTEQLDMVLGIPIIRDVYGGDIVRDEAGEILTSRCYLFVRHIDLKSIREQTQLLFDQRAITTHFQPTIGSGGTLPGKKGELSFFAFDDLFYYWELYTVAVDELIFTTISGVVAVNVIGHLLIPHWTAVLFIFPIIIMLYFFLLGTLQVCGVFINAVTYVTIVIAIGLLVDFLMHILLRYYESTGETREEKVKETLETMGASMLMGGFTTWLGVIPLSLSSTKIFNTIFVAFMAMVSWGLLVSLILMPVILSYCGPQVCTIGPRQTRSQRLQAQRERALAKMLALMKLPPSEWDEYDNHDDDYDSEDDHDKSDDDNDEKGSSSSSSSSSSSDDDDDSFDSTLHFAAREKARRIKIRWPKHKQQLGGVNRSN